MSRNIRRAVLGGFAGLAAVIVASSVAWACSAQAALSGCSNASSTTGEGPAGTKAMISGCSFDAGMAVTIYWDSATGPFLAQATGPEFSVRVQVPVTAAPGAHSFVAVFSHSGGTVPAEKRTPFIVTASDREGAAAGVGNQVGGGGNGAEPAETAPVPAQQSGPAVVTPATGSSPATGSAASNTAPASENTVAGPVTAVPAQQALPVSANPGAVRTPSGRVVFDGSTPRAAAQGPAATAQPAQARTDEAQPQVAARTAAGDLWSGFQSGTTSNPTLGLDSGSPAAGGSSAAMAGALFGAGLMALFAGFGAAELGRRRALAHTGDRTRPS